MKEETDVHAVSRDSKVTASLLDAFDLLRAPEDKAKLIGGAKIISQLQGKEDEKDVQYALKRLIRSLGANIPEVRAGYFATLVALLAKHEHLTVTQLLSLVKTELHANGASKSEVGDVALGKILVCGAVFRSGLMLRSSGQEQVEVIQLLMAAREKKSYLSTVAYLILLDFVNGLDEEQFASIVWSNIKGYFKKPLEEHTLDSLHLLLVASSKFPAKVKLRKLIGVPEILCEDNIHAICEKLMGGIDFSSISHPVYKEIGTHIANSPHLKLFWVSGIDSLLVKHNRNRELVSLNILTTILSNLQNNVEVIPDLLSKNFFKLFLDWFKGLQTASKIRSKRDNEDDHKIMVKKGKELLNALAKALKAENVTNKVRLETLKKLLFNPGEINFTELSGTTVVRSITADLDKEGVKKMAKLFKGVLLNTSKKTTKEGVDRGWYNSERSKAAELLSYLVNHETVKDETEFKLTHMKLLMCFGFFKLGGEDNIAVSSELSGSIKSCFYRCFTSRFSTVDDLVTVLSSLSNFICSILKKEEVRTKIEKQFPEENMECWEMLTEVCQSIETIQNKSKVDKVFLVLLYQLGLFLFSEPTHVKMARSAVKELKSCYEHYRKSKKKLKKTEANESDEPEWIEVLVEVLLSILATESSALRSVVQCVFRLLWEYISPSSFGQIISVLDPESESNPLSHDDSEDESDEDEVNGDDNEETEKEEDESDSNGEDQDDDDDDEAMKTPDQLRMAVQKALGAAAPETDTESVDADMIDEEEGKKLDDALAEAFKQFHQGKGRKSKKDRKDKKALSDFRIRVLDLIDIYLEKDPSMDICLGMIAPLTRCLEFCIADSQFKELENRVRKTIKTLTKVKKFASTEDVSNDILCDHLKSVTDKGQRSHFMFQALGDVITYFATFIIHCSQKIEGKSASSLAKNFEEALESYFKNRSCLLPIIFFHSVLQAEWEGNYKLVQIVIENIFNNDVRQFRRKEGVELLAGFYRSLRGRKPVTGTLLGKLADIESAFENTLTHTLTTETAFEMNNNFSVVLKKLINTMKMFHESSNTKSSIDFANLLDTIGSCKTTPKVSNVKNQVNDAQNKQLAKQKLKLNKKKRKLERMNGHEKQHKKAKKSSIKSE